MQKTTTTTSEPDLRFAVILLLLIGGVVGLFFVPGLFSDRVRESPEFQANRKRIEQMTESERARLKRRSERYNQLTDKERAAKRDLHKRVEKDPEAERLKAVLKNFNAWMASLPLVEREKVRDELQKAKTPKERGEIIAAHKDRMEDVRFVRSLPPPQRSQIERESNPERRKELIARVRESISSRSGSSRRPFVEGSDLEAVVGLISRRLNWTAKQEAELKAMTPTRRRLRIIVSAMKEHARLRREDKPGLLSDSDLRDAIEKEIEDETLKKKLFGEPSSSKFRRQYRVLSIVSTSLFRERATVAGSPTKDQLSDFFKKLSREKQDEIMREGGARQKSRLKRLYYYRGGEDGQDFADFLSEWFNVMRRYGWRRPRPGGTGSRSEGSGKRGGEGRGSRKGPRI